MNRHRVCSALFLLGLAFISSSALADLIVVSDLASGNVSLNPANTLVTIHQNAAGTESGCITPTGAILSCLNNATTHVPGGDNIGINNVLELDTIDSFVAVVTSKT